MPDRMSKPEWWISSSENWSELVYALSSLDIDLHSLHDKSSWKKVGIGLSQNNFHLTFNKQELFVQFSSDDTEQKRPLLQTNQIYDFLKQLPSMQKWLHLPIYSSPSINLFLWIEQASHFIDASQFDEIQQQCVAFFADLHRIEIDSNTNMKTLDMNTHIDNYKHEALNKRPDMRSLIENHTSQARLCSIEYKPSCFCHNDVSPTNVLLRDKDICVIDWEYACIGDPVFDLAGFSYNFGLSPEHEIAFINDYQQKSSIEFSQSRFSVMKKLYHQLTQLWFY